MSSIAAMDKQSNERISIYDSIPREIPLIAPQGWFTDENTIKFNKLYFDLFDSPIADIENVFLQFVPMIDMMNMKMSIHTIKVDEIKSYYLMFILTAEYILKTVEMYDLFGKINTACSLILNKSPWNLATIILGKYNPCFERHDFEDKNYVLGKIHQALPFSLLNVTYVTPWTSNRAQAINFMQKAVSLLDNTFTNLDILRYFSLRTRFFRYLDFDSKPLRDFMSCVRISKTVSIALLPYDFYSYFTDWCKEIYLDLMLTKELCHWFSHFSSSVRFVLNIEHRMAVVAMKKYHEKNQISYFCPNLDCLEALAFKLRLMLCDEVNEITESCEITETINDLMSDFLRRYTGFEYPRLPSAILRALHYNCPPTDKPLIYTKPNQQSETVSEIYDSEIHSYANAKRRFRTRSAYRIFSYRQKKYRPSPRSDTDQNEQSDNPLPHKSMKRNHRQHRHKKAAKLSGLRCSSSEETTSMSEADRTTIHDDDALDRIDQMQIAFDSDEMNDLRKYESTKKANFNQQAVFSDSTVKTSEDDMRLYGFVEFVENEEKIKDELSTKRERQKRRLPLWGRNRRFSRSKRK